MNLTQTEAIIAGGIIGGALAVIGISLLIFYILLVIAEWKIFKKAGEAGWKSLIPIYNAYIVFKISGMKKWFWITIATSCVVAIIGVAVGQNSQTANVISIINGIFNICVAIAVNNKLAKAFGKGIGYTIGLILLPNIFTLILGFGSAKYVGIEEQ